LIGNLPLRVFNAFNILRSGTGPGKNRIYHHKPNRRDKCGDAEVSDIVSLPHLQDGEFSAHVRKSRTSPEKYG